MTNFGTDIFCNRTIVGRINYLNIPLLLCYWQLRQILYKKKYYNKKIESITWCHTLYQIIYHQSYLEDLLCRSYRRKVQRTTLTILLKQRAYKNVIKNSVYNMFII